MRGKESRKAAMLKWQTIKGNTIQFVPDYSRAEVRLAA